MEFIDSGPMLLGLLLTGSILVSIPLHLFFGRNVGKGVLTSAVTAFLTVSAIFVLDSISVGFFNEELLLGVLPGLVISFAVSFVVFAIFSALPKASWTLYLLGMCLFTAGGYVVISAGSDEFRGTGWVMLLGGTISVTFGLFHSKISQFWNHHVVIRRSHHER